MRRRINSASVAPLLPPEEKARSNTQISRCVSSPSFWGSIVETFQRLVDHLARTKVADSDLHRLKDFDNLTCTPFAREDPNHLRTIGDLWDVFVHHTGCTGAEDPATLLKNDKWRDFGFQNSDPSSDFRGVGIFGIHNLLYFAKTYPRAFDEFFNRRNTSYHEKYPFAIAGLNITMMLLGILSLSPDYAHKSCFTTTMFAHETPTSKVARKNFISLLVEEASRETSRDDAEIQARVVERVFCEIYCIAFRVFDDQWELLRVSILDFNTVLRTTKNRMEMVLRNATSLRQLQHDFLGFYS